MRRLIFALLILAGCAHKPVVIPPGSGLYPFGKYQHHVEIHPQAPGAKAMEMRGVVSYTADAIKVIGLSSFGTTVFRIEENLKTGEIKKEFYLEIIRRHADRFVGFYKMIRELMIAPKDATDFKRGDAHFVLSQADASGIYRKIHIDHPQVILDVTVDDYTIEGAK
jgi:hypothetical protein